MKCPQCRVEILDLSPDEASIVVGGISRCPCCENLIKFEVSPDIQFGTVVSKPTKLCRHTVEGWFR